MKMGKRACACAHLWTVEKKRSATVTDKVKERQKQIREKKERKAEERGGRGEVEEKEEAGVCAPSPGCWTFGSGRQVAALHGSSRGASR